MATLPRLVERMPPANVASPRTALNKHHEREILAKHHDRSSGTGHLRRARICGLLTPALLRRSPWLERSQNRHCDVARVERFIADDRDTRRTFALPAIPWTSVGALGAVCGTRYGAGRRPRSRRPAGLVVRLDERPRRTRSSTCFAVMIMVMVIRCQQYVALYFLRADNVRLKAKWPDFQLRTMEIRCA